MNIDTLEELPKGQLKDIYSANKQALDVTKTMANAATDIGLVDALNACALGILDGINALGKIAARHDKSHGGEHCKGVEGRVKEACAHALEAEFGDDATKHATIITQYLRLVHYPETRRT